MAWARQAVDLGAGEICLNAIDTDGVQEGYELELTQRICEAVSVPVIASGGAGTPQHLIDAFQKTKVDAALVASMVHFNTYPIGKIKEAMQAAGLPVRMVTTAG